MAMHERVQEFDVNGQEQTAPRLPAENSHHGCPQISKWLPCFLTFLQPDKPMAMRWMAVTFTSFKHRIGMRKNPMCFAGRLPIWRRQNPVNGREIACFSRLRTRLPLRLGERLNQWQVIGWQAFLFYWAVIKTQVGYAITYWPFFHAIFLHKSCFGNPALRSSEGIRRFTLFHHPAQISPLQNLLGAPPAERTLGGSATHWDHLIQRQGGLLDLWADPDVYLERIRAGASWVHG